MTSKSVRYKQWLRTKELHPEQLKDGFVYIIKLSNDIYKIGRTVDLLKRLSSFRTSHIGAKFVWSAHVIDMVEAEKILHKVFGYRLLEREMFALQPKDIRRADKIINLYR